MFTKLFYVMEPLKEYFRKAFLASLLCTDRAQIVKLIQRYKTGFSFILILTYSVKASKPAILFWKAFFKGIEKRIYILQGISITAMNIRLNIINLTIIITIIILYTIIFCYAAMDERFSR